MSSRHPSLLRGFFSPGSPLPLEVEGGGAAAETLPGLRGGGRVVRLPFDPEETIDRLTSEAQFRRWRPLHSYLPFGANWMPESLRRALFRFHVRRGLSRPDLFPRWPIEPCVEEIRKVVWDAAGGRR